MNTIVSVGPSVRDVRRPFPIVLVKCWKVARWNAKKVLKNLPKIQEVATYISKVAT